MDIESYGTLQDGREVKAYVLQNDRGMEARILEYGCILQRLMVPDRSGEIADVVLGFDTLEGWVESAAYFNAIIGRYGGRINNGKVELNGKTLQLDVNRKTEHGDCHLHGGHTGLSHRLWKGEPMEAGRGEGVRLTYHSPDGESGYPGNLQVEVTYLLTEDNELRISMTGETDAPTLFNPASHTYWNLSGAPDQTILDHILTLTGDRILEIDDAVVPTGTLLEVEGTPFDFRAPHPVGERIGEDHIQLARGGGYDHYWVFPEEKGLKMAAKVHDPKSGRVMELFTNQPGVVLFTGNNLGGAGGYKGGVTYRKHSGLCLETQGYPDAPNHAHFPDCVLNPGEMYHHEMVHRFSTV